MREKEKLQSCVFFPKLGAGTMQKSYQLLSLLVLVSAVLTIQAEYTGPVLQVYLCKPLTVLFIIALALLIRTPVSERYRRLILGGLFFSLAGDIFLMLPADRFIAGLVSFLVAHLFYILAFRIGRPFSLHLYLVLPLMVFGGLIYWVLFPNLGVLKFPVLAYVLVIMVMGWQALERWVTARNMAALMAVFGALLFILSDTILAMDRFRESFVLARALTLGTYFPAQWLLALSIGKWEKSSS
jgi:uncharacterized membrane protein YhhN